MLSIAVQQLSGIVLNVPDILADLEGFHLASREQSQEIDVRLVSLFAVEPTVEISSCRIIGIRLWTGISSSLASVVMMV